MTKTPSEISKEGKKEMEEFPKGKESYCPRCYFERSMVVLRKECPHNTVILAEEGTLLAKFQKDRTEAISYMFKRDGDRCGTIHTTTKLFADLDNSVREIILSQELALLKSVEEWAEGKKKDQNPDCDCGSTIELHSPRCRATVMNKEPLIAYNHALSDLSSFLDDEINKIKS